jgi:hypothetical protein
LYYLHARDAAHTDPTMVWGTEFDVLGLQDFLQERNRTSSVLITPAHVLLWATAQTLIRHPEFNCRVVGRRIYRFRQLNLRMAMFNAQRGDVDVLLIERADTMRLEEMAGVVWRALMARNQEGGLRVRRDAERLRRLPATAFHWLLRAYSWLDRRLPLPTITRLELLRSAAVLVNDLSFRGAPPMRSYKPTRFPDETAVLNVTLGPMEEKAVVRHGEITAGTVAPLFVRADHRIVDAYRLGRFVSDLRNLLEHPQQLDTWSPRAGDAGEQGGRHVHRPAALEQPSGIRGIWRAPPAPTPSCR